MLLPTVTEKPEEFPEQVKKKLEMAEECAQL